MISVQDAAKDTTATPMQVELKLTLAEHTSLNAVSEDLTAHVRQELHDVLGVSDVPVTLRVTEIANSGTASKRTVS